MTIATPRNDDNSMRKLKRSISLAENSSNTHLTLITNNFQTHSSFDTQYQSTTSIQYNNTAKMACNFITGATFGALSGALVSRVQFRAGQLEAMMPLELGTPTLPLQITSTTPTVYITTASTPMAGPYIFIASMISLALLAFSPLLTTALYKTISVMDDNIEEYHHITTVYEMIIQSLQFKFKCMDTGATALCVESEEQREDLEEMTQMFKRKKNLLILTWMALEQMGLKDQVQSHITWMETVGDSESESGSGGMSGDEAEGEVEVED